MDRPRRLRTVPALPDYPWHHGRRVDWEGWQRSAVITCRGPQVCTQCDSTDPAWFAAARVHPLPGETFTSSEPRRRGYVPDGAYKEVEVPAWPIYWLCAFCCSECGHLEVFDMRDEFAPVDIDRPTLF